MYRNYQNLENIPNIPMEEADVEKLFSDAADMLRELVIIAFTMKLEMAQDEHADEDEPPMLVMVIDPTGHVEICTEDEGNELFEDEAPDDEMIIFDGQLILSSDYDNVAELGGVNYLIGPAVIREMDDDGNDISITDDTIRNVFDFMEANLTGIQVDGKVTPAFRLVD